MVGPGQTAGIVPAPPGDICRVSGCDTRCRMVSRRPGGLEFTNTYWFTLLQVLLQLTDLKSQTNPPITICRAKGKFRRGDNFSEFTASTWRNQWQAASWRTQHPFSSPFSLTCLQLGCLKQYRCSYLPGALAVRIGHVTQFRPKKSAALAPPPSFLIKRQPQLVLPCLPLALLWMGTRRGKGQKNWSSPRHYWATESPAASYAALLARGENTGLFCFSQC